MAAYGSQERVEQHSSRNDSECDAGHPLKGVYFGQSVPTFIGNMNSKGNKDGPWVPGGYLDYIVIRAGEDVWKVLGYFSMGIVSGCIQGCIQGSMVDCVSCGLSLK